jgi:hypothetical protein
MKSVQLGLTLLKDLYAKNAAAFADNRIAELERTGKAAGSRLQHVIDAMRRVQRFNTPTASDAAQHDCLLSALSELRTQANDYLHTHKRPLSSDGKARKKACDAILEAANTLQRSLTLARDQVQIMTDTVRDLPDHQRSNVLLTHYDEILAHPYTPADLRANRLQW